MCVNSIVLVGGDFFLNLGVVLEARHGFDLRVVSGRIQRNAVFSAGICRTKVACLWS